ncbi:MAG: TetR/AcrR family transcriptional regulator [Terriglobia bacterium]|jgi:AcrR family transcriptional regulator
MIAERSARLSAAKPSLREREQKLQRQEQILSAALEEFGANGYAATRLEDVAKRAGIAKGTIYLYFRDKERLFRAVVRTLIQKRIDALSGTFSGSAEELLRELLSQMYQVVRNAKARSIVRMLIAEGSRFPQLADIYHREVIGRGLNRIRRVLKKGVATGEFRQTKAAQFPQILVAPGVLAIVWQLLHGERHRLDLDAYSKAHLEFVLDSLRKQPD